jgi:hypothetical protein
MSAWIIALPFMCLGAVMTHLYILRKKQVEQKARREARIKYVKRRRKLKARLQRIVGDELLAARLARAEGMRLKVPSSSIEALSAAIELARQERDANRLLMGRAHAEEPAKPKGSPSQSRPGEAIAGPDRSPPRTPSRTVTGRRRTWHRSSPHHGQH